MRKLAIVFEVPDDTDYTEVVGRMIAHRAFAQGKQMAHWSFDLEMRPVGAVSVGTSLGLAEAIQQAKASIDWDHPWIPGGVFGIDEGFKPLMLAVLDALS